LQDGSFLFDARSWAPPDLSLQELAGQVVEKANANPSEAPWLRHFEDALRELGENSDASSWRRPPEDTDRLYMNVGGGDMIEVGHPQPRDREDPRYNKRLTH